MSTDEAERSLRLVASAALLALFARRRGQASRLLRTGFASTGAHDRRHDQESGQADEHDRRRRTRGDLVWSALILLLLCVVVCTAMHSAEVLVELDRLGLMPGPY